MSKPKLQNIARLKASARRMGLAIHQRCALDGAAFVITRIGNASRLYETSTVEGAFRCLSSEQDKRTKAEEEKQAMIDRCLVS